MRPLRCLLMPIIVVLLCLWLFLLAHVVQAETLPPAPTPEPTPTPDMLLMPAGDIEAVEPEAVEPTPIPGGESYISISPQGPRVLNIRVCVDANQNMRCDFGEGIAGVPIYITDVATGGVLAQGASDASGLFSAGLDTEASLSVHAPYLGVSELMQQDSVQLRIGYGLTPPKELP